MFLGFAYVWYGNSHTEVGIAHTTGWSYFGYTVRSHLSTFPANGHILVGLEGNCLVHVYKLTSYLGLNVSTPTYFKNWF